MKYLLVCILAFGLMACNSEGQDFIAHRIPPRALGGVVLSKVQMNAGQTSVVVRLKGDGAGVERFIIIPQIMDIYNVGDTLK